MPDSAPKKVVFLTVHHWRTPRHAGFHHLASAFHSLGWTTIFATVGLSPISWARRDPRCRAVGRRDATRLAWVAPGMGVFSWITPWHPINGRSARLNWALEPLAATYPHLPLFGLGRELSTANLIIFESGPPLLLAPRVRKRAPQAHLVYRQSDVPDAVGFHPSIGRAEARSTRLFDLISVPDASRLAHFQHEAPLLVQRHGVDKAAFDAAVTTPYGALSEKRAVYVGVEGLDYTFLQAAAKLRPGWAFHVIGPWRDNLRLPNVTFHGLLPYRETIPFIRHADIGLNCSLVPEGHLRTETLKTMQYTYCRLPIVAEAGVAGTQEHVLPYTTGDAASIASALARAENFPRATIPAASTRTWTDVVGELLDTLSV